MILEILSNKAVEYFLLQISGGSLQKMGADAKDSLQKLVGLLYTHFAGRPEIQEASRNPERLKSVILKELSGNAVLRDDLESLVTKLVEIEQSLSNGTVYQNSTGSGATINAPQNSGYVAGRDQSFRS